MGVDLDEVLEKLDELKNAVDSFLFVIGYTASDIEIALADLEQKLREANEET